MVGPKVLILVHTHRKVIAESWAFWTMSSGKELRACETETPNISSDLVTESM